jgi:hypothetical protein
MRATLEAEEQEAQQAAEHDAELERRIQAERTAMALQRGSKLA